jgi:hypothetical protein
VDDWRLRVADHVAARPVANEMVLLDLSREHYFALNRLAARMWQLISSGETVETITLALLEQYDVPPEVLHADVRWFVERIIDLGFVECVAVR